MQVTKGTWCMHEQGVPGSLFSSQTRAWERAIPCYNRYRADKCSSIFNFGQPFLKFGHLPGTCQAHELSREVDKLQHAVKSYTELKESSNLAADYKRDRSWTAKL